MNLIFLFLPSCFPYSGAGLFLNNFFSQSASFPVSGVRNMNRGDGPRQPRRTAPGARSAPGRWRRFTRYVSLPRQSSRRQDGYHGSGAVFITQAPTLPHRGTLGGGRRAFFICGAAIATQPFPHFQNAFQQVNRLFSPPENDPGRTYIRSMTNGRFASNCRPRSLGSGQDQAFAAHRERVDGHAATGQCLPLARP